MCISFLPLITFLPSLLSLRYQNELPKKIKSRGKDPHLTHEELVQTIKWKLAVSIQFTRAFCDKKSSTTFCSPIINHNEMSSHSYSSQNSGASSDRTL